VNEDHDDSGLQSLKSVLGFLTGDFVDVLSIGETKIDDSFPTSQFFIYQTLNHLIQDINSYSGGLLTFVQK